MVMGFGQRLARTGVWLVTFLMVLAFVSPSLAQPTVTLRVADLYSPSHAISRGSIQYFMSEASRRSGNRIQFQYFPSEQLVKANDIPHAIRSGIADIGNLVYVGNLNPILYAVQLAGLFGDDEVVEASRALWKFVRQNGTLQTTFRNLGIHPLFAFTTSNYQLITPIAGLDTLQKLRGLKVRAAGVVLPFTVRALGAVPTDININEAYEALSRGVVDAIALAVPSVKVYAFYEVIRSGLINIDLGGYPVVYGINAQKWASMPDDIRQILTEVGEDTVQHAARSYSQEIVADLGAWRQRGIGVYELSPSDKEAAVRLMAGAEGAWAQSLVERGFGTARTDVAEWKKLLADELASKS